VLDVLLEACTRGNKFGFSNCNEISLTIWLSPSYKFIMLVYY